MNKWTKQMDWIHITPYRKHSNDRAFLDALFSSTLRIGRKALIGIKLEGYLIRIVN